MTRTEEFAAFRERRRVAEAEADRGRVTWRKVAIETGGGWSGIGSAGPRLVVRVKRSDERRLIGRGRYGYVYNIWLLRDGRSVLRSTHQLHGGTIAEAKRTAEERLTKAIAADAATSNPDPEEGHHA